jgi:hypothetical protein
MRCRNSTVLDTHMAISSLGGFRGPTRSGAVTQLFVIRGRSRCRPDWDLPLISHNCSRGTPHGAFRISLSFGTPPRNSSGRRRQGTMDATNRAQLILRTKAPTELGSARGGVRLKGHRDAWLFVLKLRSLEPINQKPKGGVLCSFDPLSRSAQATGVSSATGQRKLEKRQ